MSYLHLKENNISEMSYLPPTRLGKKRRSSILKQDRPFTDVQNISRSRDDSRLTKERRVSFCPTIEVKEFHKHKPTDAPKSVSSQEDGENVAVKQVSLGVAEEEAPQMSTPVKKKRRRISTASQIDRLSIIPRFEKSFTLPEDDDFPIFDDNIGSDGVQPPTTAPREDITLYEETPHHDDPLAGDAMLAVNDIVASEHQSEPQNQTPPPFSSPPQDLPTLTNEDTQRLAELFPGAPVPSQPQQPTVSTNTPVSNTFTALSNNRLYYMKMATPDMMETPQRPAKRKRISLSPDDTLRVGGGGGGGGGTGGVSIVVAGSPLSHGATALSELMSLTCVESGHAQTDTDHTHLNKSANNEEESVIALNPHKTVSDSVAMVLTCEEEVEEKRVVEVVEEKENAEEVEEKKEENWSCNEVGSTMVLTCAEEEENDETHTSNAETESIMVLTCEEEVEEDEEVRTAVTKGEDEKERVEGVEEEEGQTVVMDMTCQSEISLSTTVLTNESDGTQSTITHDTSHLANESQPANKTHDTTWPVEENEALPDNEPVEDTESEEVPPPPRQTSPVFKVPRGPFRSQLKLRSSEKKVVAATPVIRTPRPIPLHSSVLSSSSSFSSSRPQLNTTFTLSQATPIHSSSSSHTQTPVTEPLSIKPASRDIEEEEEENPDLSVLECSNPPSVLTVTVPTYRPTSSEGSRGRGLNSSVLASPADIQTPLLSMAGGTNCGWLQTTAEDSFKLISSDSDTSPTQHHPAFPDGVHFQLDSQGNLSFITPCTQPVEQALPTTTTPTSDHTTRLTEALERLKMTAPSHPPLPDGITTPEVIQVVESAPPTSPSQDLIPPHPLTKDFNDTTYCGTHSPSLSASIYHKFLNQIDRERPVSDPACVTLSVSTESVSQQATNTMKSTSSFHFLLSDLTSCLQGVLRGVLLRLNSKEYCSTHHCLSPVLDKWSRVFAACLGTLIVLQQYGEMTGDSKTCDWESGELSIELPLPPLGEEDMQQNGNSKKLEWIMELSGFYQTLTPIAELARDRAAELYGWLFEEWTHDSHNQNVTVIIGSKTHQFQISVSEIAAGRIGDIASELWSHISRNSASP